MSREAAITEVRRAVDGLGTRAAFAAKAGVDAGTLGDFLEGKRWPQAVTRTKIEKALRWPVGRIADLARSDSLPVLGGVETHDDAVIQAILDDPRLLPEAKTHLVNQYGLLLRVQSQTATPQAMQAAATRDQLADLRAGRRPPAAKKATASQKGAAKAATRKAAAKRPN